MDPKVSVDFPMDSSLVDPFSALSPRDQRKEKVTKEDKEAK
jgi:hypothetical protein